MFFYVINLNEIVSIFLLQTSIPESDSTSQHYRRVRNRAWENRIIHHDPSFKITYPNLSGKSSRETRIWRTKSLSPLSIVSFSSGRESWSSWPCATPPTLAFLIHMKYINPLDRTASRSFRAALRAAKLAKRKREREEMERGLFPSLLSCELRAQARAT